MKYPKINIIKRKLKHKSMEDIVRKSLADLNDFMPSGSSELAEKTNESLRRNYFQVFFFVLFLEMLETIKCAWCLEKNKYCIHIQNNIKDNLKENTSSYSLIFLKPVYIWTYKEEMRKEEAERKWQRRECDTQKEGGIIEQERQRG